LDHTVHYLTTEQEVNDALANILDGTIGFNTEFVPRKLTPQEALIDEVFSTVPGNKRSGIIAWQALQIEYGGGFEIVWDNIGLCIIQIAGGTDVWLLNMNRIRDEIS
jgi:hypothetical protein